MKKKIVVTGANGQLGSELRDLLAGNITYESVFLDVNELDLTDTDSIQERLSSYAPDIIIHGAAYTAVDKAESEQELSDKINHLATAEIAKYCASHGCKLIAISTDYVFDGNSSIALTEDAAVDPINVYGKTKLDGELAIQRILSDAIIVRTAWVYSVYGNNFVKTMIRLMSEREELSVINDQIGSPTYARDLARALVKIVESNSWTAGIYHYSNEGEISWFDFAEAIRAIAGLNCQIHPIPSTSYPTPAKRPKYSLLNKGKIKDTYGVEVPDWRASLQEMISALQQTN